MSKIPLNAFLLNIRLFYGIRFQYFRVYIVFLLCKCPISSLFYYAKSFHPSVSWWFPTVVWLTASLLKSPGLISVFWPIIKRLVSTHPLTSKSCNLSTNPLGIVLNAPITTGIPVTFIFYYYYYYYYYHYYYHHLLHWSFSHQRQLMVFHWSLSDSNSPQVSRTLLSILAVLNNVVVWMVSTRPPTSNSSSPFSNPLVTVPKASITIGIIVTFMFHSFFQFSSKVEVLIIINKKKEEFAILSTLLFRLTTE